MGKIQDQIQACIDYKEEQSVFIKKSSITIPVFENFTEMAQYLSAMERVLKEARLTRNTHIGGEGCHSEIVTDDVGSKSLQGLWIAVPIEDFQKLRDAIEKFDRQFAAS